MASAIRPTLAVLILLGIAACSADSRGRFAEALRCTALEASEHVEFDGRQLIEIPDIASPAMRRANLQLSSGCYGYAQNAVEQLLRRQPLDAEALYVLARRVWISQGTDVGEANIRALVAMHPDFTSGRVLLSGLRIEQGRLDEASQILDDIEASAPDDIWIWLNRIRIEASTAPSDEVRELLLAIQSNPRFPPNVRESAGQQLRRTRFVTPEQYEATYALSLEYQSNAWIGCKLTNYAAWLMQSQGRVDDAVAVIESHLDDGIDCSGMRVDGWDLLAYASLLQAAEIAPEPSPGNEALVERARMYAGGDFSGLASWLAGGAQEQKLRPFLIAGLDPDAPAP